MNRWVFPVTIAILSAPMTAQAENALYDPIKRAGKMMQQMDADHNGSVSAQEYLRPANIRFQRFDTDKNGVIARQELYDYWKNKRKIKTDNINAWEGPTNAHFKKYDTNKDDIITRAEYLLKSELRFKDLDLDNDQSISRQELNHHWQERRKELDGYDFSEKDDD